MLKIENDFLAVHLAVKGAEVTSVYDKVKQRDVLWEGNPLFWKGQSPILFPNVGKSYLGKMQINGKDYPTVRHGFARGKQFTCVESSAEKISFLLSADKNTKQDYPFDFRLYVHYSLEDKKLKVEWEVQNSSDDTMYFTIGGHPAIRFADKHEKKSDYYLKFPGKDKLEYLLTDFETGTGLPKQTYPILLDQNRLPLSEKLFEKDALIFDGAQIEEVWLYTKSGEPYIGMKCQGFNNFGIWSVKDAPFVCLEPWAGRCDDYGFEAELSQKPGVNALEAHGIYRKEYWLIIA